MKIQKEMDEGGLLQLLICVFSLCKHLVSPFLYCLMKTISGTCLSHGGKYLSNYLQFTGYPVVALACQKQQHDRQINKYNLKHNMQTMKIATSRTETHLLSLVCTQTLSLTHTHTHFLINVVNSSTSQSFILKEVKF